MRRFLSVLLLVLVASSQACGVKKWPAPVSGEDALAWGEAVSFRDGACLDFLGTVQGDMDNVETIVLLIESRTLSRHCPQCPFDPGKRVDLNLSDSRLEVSGNRIRFDYCGLDPYRYVRWRVYMVNTFTSLGWTQTPLFPQASDPDQNGDTGGSRESLKIPAGSGTGQ